jgi:hypothetical protein
MDGTLLVEEEDIESSGSMDSMEIDSVPSLSSSPESASELPPIDMVNLTREDEDESEEELCEAPFGRTAESSFFMDLVPRADLSECCQDCNDIVLELLPSGIHIGCARLLLNRLPLLALTLHKIEHDPTYQDKLLLGWLGSLGRAGGGGGHIKKPVYRILQRPEDVGEEALMAAMLRFLTEDHIFVWSTLRSSRGQCRELKRREEEKRMSRLSPFLENGKILALLDMATYYGYRELSIEIRRRLAYEVAANSDWRVVFEIVKCFSRNLKYSVDGDFANKREDELLKHPIMSALLHRFRMMDEEGLSSVMRDHTRDIVELPTLLLLMLTAFSGSHGAGCRKKQLFARMALERVGELSHLKAERVEGNDKILKGIADGCKGEPQLFVKYVESIGFGREHHPLALPTRRAPPILRRAKSVEQPDRSSSASRPEMRIRTFSQPSAPFPWQPARSTLIVLDTCFVLKSAPALSRREYTSSLAAARHVHNDTKSSISFFIRALPDGHFWQYELGVQWQHVQPTVLTHLRVRVSYELEETADRFCSVERSYADDRHALSGCDPLILCVFTSLEKCSSDPTRLPTLSLPFHLTAHLTL